MHLVHFSPIIPFIGTLVWWGGLMAMIITWRAQGRPHYVSQEGSVPFISDIGADILKPLFIPVCSITAVCFALSLVAARWLRHAGRLPPNIATLEKVFAGIAIFGATLGGVALILLSIFDTKRHRHTHRAFLLIFIIGVAISAIFTVLEFHWLSKSHAHLQRLKRSYIAKAIIVTVLVALAIAFGVTIDTRHAAAGVLEWIIAFGFGFYLVTFFFDLYMTRDVTEEDTQEYMLRKRGTRRY